MGFFDSVFKVSFPWEYLPSLQKPTTLKPKHKAKQKPGQRVQMVYSLHLVGEIPDVKHTKWTDFYKYTKRN